ncbi:hypothetical protein WEI85_05930 [Actinomycetes bacterium KLBMP 9797]
MRPSTGVASANGTRYDVPSAAPGTNSIPAGVAPRDLLACRLADALYRSGNPTGAAQVATAALQYVAHPDYLDDLHWIVAQSQTVEGRAEEALAGLSMLWSLDANRRRGAALRSSRGTAGSCSLNSASAPAAVGTP